MTTSNYGIWCTEPGATGSSVVSQTPMLFTNAQTGETQTLYLTHIRGEVHDNKTNFREITGNNSAIENHAERILNELTEEGWRTEDMRTAPPVFTRASNNYFALSDLVKEIYGDTIPYKSRR
jgi:hypothetical protein